MGLQVTPAQAKALQAKARSSSSKPPARQRASRQSAPKERGKYRTRCVGCGEVFTTMTAEGRHAELGAGHARFEGVFDG